MSSLPPFIYRDAVPPEHFFNRHNEIKFLESKLEAGERRLLIAIVAPLKFGKTSLMLKYIDIVKKYADIIPLYIDLRKSSEPIRRIASAVLKGEKLEKLYEEARKSAENLDSLFAAINEELARAGKWLFIFFDEFHLLPEAVRTEGFLEKFSDERIFLFFRAAAEHRRISYIVCGSIVESLMEALDVWGGRFETIYLGPFSKRDAIYMMKKLFAEAEMDVSDAFLEELCDAAGYHPFYMQYMGSVIYSAGKASRLALREAKKRLWEYISPIFDDYVRRLWREDARYVSVLRKVARGEKLNGDEPMLARELMRKGFLRRGNGAFFHVDPLFARYVSALELTEAPPDVSVVGHWAERIVGNYLLKKGYLPYYSHDSRGAFDIYVRVGDTDVGIQVRYSSSGVVRVSEEEVNKIRLAAKETGWVPLLALVSRGIDFFPLIASSTHKQGEGFAEIEDALKIAKRAIKPTH